MEYVLDNPIIFKYLREIEEEYNKVVNYIDVTDDWLKNATPNSHKVLDRNYYEYNGKIYKVEEDNKNVILDYTQDEKETAQWIENVFGGEIYMNPKVNFPKNIETADYLWNKELWDKKGMKKSTSVKRSFDNAIKSHRNQTHNFIIDLTGSNLNDEIIVNQVYNAFTKDSKFYRKWLEKVIIKRDNKLVKIIIKK